MGEEFLDRLGRGRDCQRHLLGKLSEMECRLIEKKEALEKVEIQDLVELYKTNSDTKHQMILFHALSSSRIAPRCSDSVPAACPYSDGTSSTPSLQKQGTAKVIFGLNALTGRTIGPGGVCTVTNAESLMRHTVNSGYTIHGWELGNELSGNSIGASVAADQYAADVITLDKKVQEIYKGFDTKPLVPGGFFDGTWFARFFKGASGSLQVITHHIYNLGPGVDEHLIEKILDPSYLDGEAQTFKDLRSIVKSSASGAVAWVGEAGGAYNSGRNLVTNAFVFSFWYLNQLGMSAAYDSKTYCRQSFVGGNYGLIDTNTFVPNPDYYSALLWHGLMGRRVVSTSFSGTSKMRAYAHCSKNRNGITLPLINLGNTTTVQVGVSVEKLTLEQAVLNGEILQLNSSG
ncbi:hypothetical protein SASPL_121472 [Salvia splendens]|uniref:Heparanase 1 n=1 Tax=Salvia splendens TaxID=180675 RepID=A0A8X8XRY9_SALSN|nr:hypothetical protein SASPL_121472 [Salvia splendens]